MANKKKTRALISEKDAAQLKGARSLEGKYDAYSAKKKTMSEINRIE